nr:hypothetical protein [Solemoviridae sp.]
MHSVLRNILSRTFTRRTMQIYVATALLTMVLTHVYRFRRFPPGTTLGDGALFGLGIQGVLLFIGLLWDLGKAWKLRRAEWLEFTSQKITPESIRPGSDIMEMNTPSYLASVFGKIDDKKVYLGSAWRHENWLITAAHVVMDKGVPRDTYFTKATKEHLVPMKCGKWIQVDTDLAIMELDDKMKAGSGLTSAKVGILDPASHRHVMCISSRPQQNASLGVLRHVPEMAAGFVQYDGSTMAGFSGGVYTNSISVFAMHCSGGELNYGLAVSYILMKIRAYRKGESEIIYDIQKALRGTKKENLHWEFGLDEVHLRIGGQYWTLDNEEFQLMIEDEYYERYFYEEDDWSDDRMERRKNLRSKKYDEVSEPDMEFECEKAFLEKKPALLASRSEEDMNAITSLGTSMSETEITPQRADIIIHAETEGKSSSVSPLTLKDVEGLLSNTLNLLSKNFNELLHTQLAAIQLDFESRLDTMTQTLKDISTTSLEHSSKLAQLDSPKSSRAPQPLATSWDGMESDMSKFREWRSSVDASLPNYVILRGRFLEGLQLTPEQQLVLIRWYKNTQESRRQKRAKTAKVTAQ